MVPKQDLGFRKVEGGGVGYVSWEVKLVLGTDSLS